MLPEWYLSLTPIMSYPILWVLIIAIGLFLTALGLSVLAAIFIPLPTIFSSEAAVNKRIIAVFISVTGVFLAIPVLGVIDQVSELTTDSITKQLDCYKMWLFDDNKMLLKQCNANSMAHVYYHELCESCSDYKQYLQENKSRQ